MTQAQKDLVLRLLQKRFSYRLSAKAYAEVVEAINAVQALKVKE